MIGINYLVQAVFGSIAGGNQTISMVSYILIIGGAVMAFTSFLLIYR